MKKSTTKYLFTTLSQWLFLAALLTPSTFLAQTQKSVIIPIETQNNALVLATDKDNRLCITHFGKRLQQANEYAAIVKQYWQNDANAGIYNAAYTSSGSTNLVEPALNITHSDGNTSTELKYISHETQKQGENITLTTVLLKDEIYEVEVALFFKTYSKEDVFEQWVVIKNKEKGTIELEKYASANLHFMADNYFLTSYSGSWGREMKPEETKLTNGIKTLDSKLGARANLFAPPTFQLSFDRPASEDEGKVLLGQLGWSGNFKIDFEMDSYHHLRLIAGINPHASEYPLETGQTLKTPSLVYTYSEKGKGLASRNLHRWAKNYRILDGNGSRLTLLNNWEATYFDFDEKKLVNLFKGAKKLGVDMFLLDDGWFGNKHPRNDDFAGLGDWQENKKKLPQGIGYLVKEATAAGIKFGIWLEPEMVNPRSELYEKHKDWVIRQPQRPEHYFRNQLVLDLTNPEVQDFVYHILDDLFGKNPQLAFVKWDCNAVIYNAHSQYLEKTKQKQTKLYVDYVKGLYKILEKIRNKYPSVNMMLCSGGGGRVDYEALKYFTEFWPSDNTHPLERVFIQWDYSYFYPAIAVCNHVTDWDKSSIKFRCDVAMMGKMGFDVDVEHLKENDFISAQKAVADYNSFKEVVWHGDLYRLSNPWEQPVASLMYVDEKQDKAIMFNYLVSNRFEFSFTFEPFKLKGLDPNKKYKIRELNLYPATKTTLNEAAIFSGDFLMSVGYNPDITLNRKSVVLEIKAVN
jgi:alpha-galactosidase